MSLRADGGTEKNHFQVQAARGAIDKLATERG